MMANKKMYSIFSFLSLSLATKWFEIWMSTVKKSIWYSIFCSSCSSSLSLSLLSFLHSRTRTWLCFLLRWWMAKLKCSHSAGSSSNVSSSNGNNSDDHGFNSLEDSIENDDIQQSNHHHHLHHHHQQHQHVDHHRHKNRIPTLITSSDSMSYLGPFNFRQLLRPVHERNNARNNNVPSQRKRSNMLTATTPNTASVVGKVIA